MGTQLIADRYVPGRVKARSVLACFALLAMAKVLVGTVGLARTRRLIERLTHTSAPRDRVTPGSIDTVAQAVATAAAFYPGRALCLEQSVVLYYLLRRVGLTPRMRLGVTAQRFEAHAWVECDGKPVHEDPEMLKRFTPFLDIVL